MILSGKNDYIRVETFANRSLIVIPDSENLSPDAPGNDHIGSGETFKTKLNQYEKHIQVRYLSMSNNWDATCYAWVTVQNLDGSASHGTWTGDIGSMCGMKWYPSGQIAGTYEEDGSPWRPRCAWLDAEGDKKWASLKFDVVALGPLEAHHTINSNTICDSMLLSESAAHIEGSFSPPSSFLILFSLPSLLNVHVSRLCILLTRT